jgi:hypothetical protein
MTQRHDKSRRILGTGVLSQEKRTEIILDNDPDVEQLARDGELLKDIGGLGAESRLRHMAMLEQHREQAVQLPEYLLSARGYRKQHSRVFVLLKYERVYHPIIFNILKRQIETLEDLEILDMIACEVSEPRAVINPKAIEHFAN